MKHLIAFAALAASLVSTPVLTARADALSGSSCPGRVAIIERVEHPTDSAGDRDHRSAWAIRTTSAVAACVADGVISHAYGYYLNLKVTSRNVRYVCLIGDETEKRNALGTFDLLVNETRPSLIGSAFASLTDDLQSRVHSDCQ